MDLELLSFYHFFLFVCTSACCLDLAGCWVTTLLVKGMDLETFCTSSFSQPPLSQAGAQQVCSPHLKLWVLSSGVKGHLEKSPHLCPRGNHLHVHLLCPGFSLIFLLLGVHLFLVTLCFNQRWTCEDLCTQIRRVCHSWMRERESHAPVWGHKQQRMWTHQDLGISVNQNPDVLSAQHKVKGRPGNLKVKMILCIKWGNFDSEVDMWGLVGKF